MPSSLASGTTTLTSSSMSSYSGSETSQVEKAKHLVFAFFAQLQVLRPVRTRTIVISMIQMFQLLSLCFPFGSYFHSWGNADNDFFQWIRLTRTIGVDRGRHDHHRYTCTKEKWRKPADAHPPRTHRTHTCDRTALSFFDHVTIFDHFRLVLSLFQRLTQCTVCSSGLLLSTCLP